MIDVIIVIVIRMQNHKCNEVENAFQIFKVSVHPTEVYSVPTMFSSQINPTFHYALYSYFVFHMFNIVFLSNRAVHCAEASDQDVQQFVELRNLVIANRSCSKCSTTPRDNRQSWRRRTVTLNGSENLFYYRKTVRKTQLESLQ